MQSCPFTRGHSSQTFTIYFSLNFCYRCKIGQTVINNKITFSSHTAYNNSIGYLVIVYYFISETISFGCMSFFMCHQGLNILCRKPIFYRRTFSLFYITKGLGIVCRFRICKLTYVLIFTETDNIDTLTMLWYTKIHGVHYLRVRHIIIKVVTQYIENRFNSLSFIMNKQSFYIFEKECARAFAADYLSHIKE